MIIRAEGVNYQVRDGVRPDAAQYRQVRNLGRAERVLELTRVTIGTATGKGDTTAALKLTYEAERKERQVATLREGLKAVLA